jgi:catechol 2,3-dioxygenase-like lactoylglutathione lyase family enzyme
MTPKLNGIDHLHIYVANWDEAEEWYQTVLSFRRVEALMFWTVKNGPLTVENPEGNIHLALFETDSSSKSISSIAFAVGGEVASENFGFDLESNHRLARRKK